MIKNEGRNTFCPSYYLILGENDMSQAKVEQHKKDKANRKKNMAKERAQGIAARICAIVVLAAIVGWAGYTGYQYYESTRPMKTIYTDTSAITDYVQGLNGTEAE